jgi:hypothetical protein
VPRSLIPWQEELSALLRTLRPHFGAVGSKDHEVAAQQRAIDRALALLTQGFPAPVLFIPVTQELPPFDSDERVLVYTDGVEFAGEQYFDIKASDLYPCATESEPDGDRYCSEVAAAATHWCYRPTPRTRRVASVGKAVIEYARDVADASQWPRASDPWCQAFVAALGATAAATEPMPHGD